LSAPELVTLSERSLLGMINSCPVGGFTSVVRAKMTMIAFIPTASPGLQRDW
jgi:hypothetical protein